MLKNVRITRKKITLISSGVVAFLLLTITLLLSLHIGESYAVNNGGDTFTQFCSSFYNVTANSPSSGSSDKYNNCLNLKPLFLNYLQSYKITYGSTPTGDATLTPAVNANSTPINTPDAQNSKFRCSWDQGESSTPTNTSNYQNSWSRCHPDGGPRSASTDPANSQNTWARCSSAGSPNSTPTNTPEARNSWSQCYPGSGPHSTPTNTPDAQNSSPLCSSAMTPSPANANTSTPVATITPTPIDTSTPVVTITPTPIDTSTPVVTITPTGNCNIWPNVSLVGLIIPADAGRTGTSIPATDIAQVKKI